MEFISLIIVTLFIHQSIGLAVPTPDPLKFSGKVFFYGSENEKPDNSLCAVGEVINVDGTCNPSSGKSERNWSSYAAASKLGESSKIRPRPKMKYDIVVIHPNEKKQEDPIIIPPPAEKNVVVVLRKGPKEKAPKIIEASTLPPLSPEVHFIDYKEGSNMLLPGGIDLKTALARAQFMANRIKIGENTQTSEEPKNERKSPDETKLNYLSEDAKMNANFERFVRSNMEKNTNKSIKDIVYDYILEGNLSDNDSEIDHEHPGGDVDVTEKTGSSTIQVSDDVLKASSHFDSLKDNKNDHETNIEENKVTIMETTAMTPLKVVKNEEAARVILVEPLIESPPITNYFLGEPLAREFSSVWKGITNSYREPLEISTENSIHSSGSNRRTLPASITEIARKVTLRNSDPVNQFNVPNHSSPLATKETDSHLNDNHNHFKSDVEVIKVDKTSLDDNQPLKSDKIVPEIETFFKELLKGANPDLGTNKFDYVIKEMSKIVAESNIFKIQLQKLKKEGSESSLSIRKNEENEGNKLNYSSNSSEIIKFAHKFDDNNEIRIPNWQESIKTQISNNIKKLEQIVHTAKDTKTNLSNVLKSGQGKGVVAMTEKDDLLIIPKYSNARPSSQQIGSSYNRFMSSYLNSYPNMKASYGNSDKDSSTEVKEFTGKVGSISKTFADGWRGMEFTVSSPEKFGDEKQVPNYEHNNKRKINYSENMKLRKYETNNNSDLRVNEFEENQQSDSKSLKTKRNQSNNSHILIDGGMGKPAAHQLIEEGRAYSTNSYGNAYNKYDISHDKHGIYQENRKQIGNGHSDSSSKMEMGGAEKTKKTSDFESGNQSEIDLRLKSSGLEKQQLKEIAPGDIIYGRQKTSEPILKSLEQISNHDNKNEHKVNAYDNGFNNHTQISPNTNTDKSSVDGVKYIIEKIMAAKPFESGHKIISATEQIPITENTHYKKVVTATSGAAVDNHHERDTGRSAVTNRPVSQQFHKMVTISLGINITDPTSMKVEKFGTNRAIVKPQIAKTSSFDDIEVDRPLNTENLSSSLTNKLQSYPVPENLKKEVIANAELNFNNIQINKDNKSTRNASKFSIDEVKKNPYSNPIHRNHSNEFEWNPLDTRRNETELQLLFPLRESPFNGLRGEVSSTISEPSRDVKKQELLTLINSGKQPPSILVGTVIGSQKNIVKSSKDSDEPPLVRKSQLSRLKKESEPLTISEEIIKHSNTRRQQHEEPSTGRPWLRAAIRL